MMEFLLYSYLKIRENNYWFIEKRNFIGKSFSVESSGRCLEKLVVERITIFVNNLQLREIIPVLLIGLISAKRSKWW
jgi:hypothetical protein